MAPLEDRSSTFSLTGLESMLAGRYLRLLKARTAHVYWVPGGFLITLAIMRVALYWLEHHKRGVSAYAAWRMALESGLRIGSYAAIGLMVLLGVLVWLIRRYTIFTSISTMGLYIGSSLLVIVLSVMSGFEQDLEHKILGANAHILVTSPDEAFSDYEKVAERLRGIRGVDSVMPYLSNEVMVSSQANLAGVIVKGIDPVTAAHVTDLEKNMEQGKLENLLHPERLQDVSGPPDLDEDVEPPGKPAPADKEVGNKEVGNKEVGNKEVGNKEPAAKEPATAAAKEAPKPKMEFVATDSKGKPLPFHEPKKRKVLPGILIGRELAKNLRLYLGDDVNVISPMGDIGPSGPIPRSRPFRVAGIFYSGMYEYDTKNIYMTIPAAQKFLSLGDEVTGLEIRVRDPNATAPIDEAIEKSLAIGKPGQPNQYEVKDWQQLNRNLFSALKVEKIAMFIVLCFIILVAGFSIIANGIMLVREKEREIAILKSMGASDRSVLKTFLYIGLYMGSIGITAGILTGVGTCLALGHFGLTLDTDVYYIAKLPVVLNPWEIGAVFLASMSIALLATLYPALVAARLRPVEGLRYDHG